MILHGKDLIVSINGNSLLASKSCTLNVSAKSIVKTSPTSGDWEEVLSGKKSWSLTTNHFEKQAESVTPSAITNITAFAVTNMTSDGWRARGECKQGANYVFDEAGYIGGIDVLRVNGNTCQLIESQHFSKDATGLISYLNDVSITNDDILLIMTNGEYVLPANIVSILSTTYHTALPCIEMGRPSEWGSTYDTTPIIIACGKGLAQGYIAMNSIGNDIHFTLVNGTNLVADGISGNVDMVGQKVTIRIRDAYDESGTRVSKMAGQAIITQFKVTGTKGNLMAGSFSFKGNSELQTDKKIDMPDIIPAQYADYIVLNMKETNPSKMITGDINGNIIREIRSSFHRYLAVIRGGSLKMCQLADDNTSKYNGGDIVALDGTRGDVLTKHCTFYTKTKLIESGVYQIGFSLRALSGWVEHSENDIIGSYEASVTTEAEGNTAYTADDNTGYLRSISGVTPQTNITMSNLAPKATRKGTGFTTLKMRHHNLIGTLFMAIYGNTNSQSLCGLGNKPLYGITSNIIPTGYSNSLGTKDSSPVDVIVNFLSLENWWGNVKEYIDNVTINNTTWHITDNGQTRSVIGLSENAYKGFFSAVAMGENLDLVPTKFQDGVNGEDDKGNPQKGFCDMFDITGGEYICRSSEFSGGDTTQGIRGIFYLDRSNTKNLVQGTRLCYKGDFEILTPADYEALFQ